jgi:uncharacterized membrane protein
MQRQQSGWMDDLPRRVTSFWLWPLVLFVGAIAFFVSPGEYGGTARALLHGLCAQTPSHTLTFGDRPLPFDSRMTGIYGGFLVTIAWIVATGRLLRYGNPPKLVVAALAALVALMAIDGFNSLFTDLGVWHPYGPSNAMRIVTGYGTGVTLAVALSWLLASSLWHLSVNTAGVTRLRELAIPIGLLAAYGVLLWWRPVWLHLPVSALLVISAWIVVTMLALVIVLLALRLDATIRRVEQLHVPVATASLIAIVIMMALAGGRFWIEHQFGISNAMM